MVKSDSAEVEVLPNWRNSMRKIYIKLCEKKKRTCQRLVFVCFVCDSTLFVSGEGFVVNVVVVVVLLCDLVLFYERDRE